MNYKSALCSCIVCHSLKSAKGIFSHYIIAHTSDGRANAIANGIRSIPYTEKVKRDSQLKRWKEYYATPKHCLNCNTELDWFHRNSKFCCMSCAATFNNLNAPITRKRGKTAIPKIKKIIEKKVKTNIFSGSYSKLAINKCNHCSISFVNQRRKKYCEKCKSHYSDNGRVPYYFKFNIYNHPELFDLSLIEKHGWFSNCKNKSNINGVSRDHKVSVNEAIKNCYNPYYISHLMNCELILHKQNQKKNAKSSINYYDLVRMVDEYDLMVHEEPTYISVRD